LSCTVYNVDIYVTTQRPARVHVPVFKYIRYTQAIAHFAVLGAQNNVTHIPSHIYMLGREEIMGRSFQGHFCDKIS